MTVERLRLEQGGTPEYSSVAQWQSLLLVEKEAKGYGRIDGQYG